MPIQIIPVIPTQLQRIDVDAAVDRAKKVVDQESEIHERKFDAFTRTWTAPNKPNWRREVKDSGDDYEVILSTTSTPFVFVEKGTSIRYRVMSKNFVPKTKPRVIGSGGGAGYAAGFGVKPGIQARNIRTEIAERRQPQFARKMVYAMRIRPSVLGGGVRSIHRSDVPPGTPAFTFRPGGSLPPPVSGG